VTNLLRHLLSAYASYFQIFAYAAVTRILPPSSTTPFYTLETSRGTSIKTARIIHATNAYVNHLLPILRHKLFPLRVTMTAQRPGLSFPSKVYDGRRSWAFIYPGGFDYLTQLPDGDRELMLGGGHSYAPHEGMGEFGIVDDSKVHMRVEGYLSGALPIMFGLSNWGEEGRASTANGDDSKWEKGRVKAVWSGVITYSADTLTPWVGPLTQKMTSRSIPPGGGEWIAAGYSGEGMVHAWGCGKAVAMNVLDLEEREGEELPKEFWITGAKLKRAVVERMYEAIDDQH
jgi:glycine/D-amino acid oxidase-like deaminating enzyme